MHYIETPYRRDSCAAGGTERIKKAQAQMLVAGNMTSERGKEEKGFLCPWTAARVASDAPGPPYSLHCQCSDQQARQDQRRDSSGRGKTTRLWQH